MPTQLTDPIIKVAATQATVDKWVLDLARGGDFSVDPEQSVFAVVMNLRDGLGNIIETRKLERTIEQLPAPIKADMRALQTRLIDVLGNAGLLPEGTDTDDV